MLLKNNKKILIYGFNKEEEDIINNLLLKSKLPSYKVIEESMGKMKIKDILENLKFEIYDCKLPQEKVVLINNFDDKELNTIISAIRNSFSSAPILAVITETSINWSFDYLLKHLIEERELFKKPST